MTDKLANDQVIIDYQIDKKCIRLFQIEIYSYRNTNGQNKKVASKML